MNATTMLNAISESLELTDTDRPNVFWASNLTCYVTVPEPDICPVCGDRDERHEDLCQGDPRSGHQF